MQRSIPLIGGIAGALASIATTYVFNPLTQCDVISNSLSTMTTYPDAIKFAVSNYAIKFQNDFVNFFYQHYPSHGQDFHNLLMSFDGYGRTYEIGWNVSSLAFESFKTIVFNSCVESASNSSYAKSAALGVAAGASLALLAQQFSLFKTETINHDPRPSQQHLEELPSRQVNNNNEISLSERVARLNKLKIHTVQDVKNHRIALGYKR